MSRPPVAPGTVELFALFTQAALYGLYLATLIDCLRWLVYTDEGWKQRDRTNKLMLTTSIIIFLCSTVNLALFAPNQFLLMGDSDLGPIFLSLLQVCKYHGWHLGQKVTCILLFPGFDRVCPDSNCRCGSGLSRFVGLKVLGS